MNAYLKLPSCNFKLENYIKETSLGKTFLAQQTIFKIIVDQVLCSSSSFCPIQPCREEKEHNEVPFTKYCMKAQKDDAHTKQGSPPLDPLNLLEKWNLT